MSQMFVFYIYHIFKYINCCTLHWYIKHVLHILHIPYLMVTHQDFFIKWIPGKYDSSKPESLKNYGYLVRFCFCFCIRKVTYNSPGWETSLRAHENHGVTVCKLLEQTSKKMNQQQPRKCTFLGGYMAKSNLWSTSDTRSTYSSLTCYISQTGEIR